MKKILCAAFLASAAILTSAQADTLPAPVICVVAQTTLDKSAALKSIVSQLEKKRTEIQKELSTDETKLKAEDKELSEKQKKMTEKEFAEKRQAFEKKVREVQSKLEIRRVQMELAFEEAKKKVYEAFLKVADEVKQGAGANIMLYKETVVTADAAFDLSNQVLEKLDKSLPTVQVTFKSEADIKQLIQQQQAQQ
ncbi:MAG: OmpH family outer membrane protein [Proteobacteria bacterium]|nr:OmpH family outer membrane protein [Pseudomonadota bacterium]